ncbi:IFM2 protein, partial [Geococcyx californianus]|nr:IFM2 protein [Geococcyx californianus]
ATAFGPTITTYVQQEPVPSPRDYVLWSFFNTLFCNVCCLGFIALSYSVKARDRKIARDPAGADVFANTAKKVNISAVCIGSVVIIIAIVLLVINTRHLPWVGP